MTYRATGFAQDASIGRVGRMLECIGSTADSVAEFDRLDAGVAYASKKGVELLATRLALAPTWEAAKKRFLVSIDFGITHPDALANLGALPNAEVRVPNGAATLASSRLLPPATFHAKCYQFTRSDTRYPYGVAMGSANMTANALLTGSEVFASHVWSGTVTRPEARLHREFEQFTTWFDDAWRNATPLAAVLPAYRTRFRANLRRRAPSEDLSPPVKTYLSAPGSLAISGELAVQLQTAKALWIKTNKLYGNLRQGTLGNQLDTPRGTRLFFGMPPEAVPRNTIVGHVAVQCVGFGPVKRSIRHADNQMDKVNLPVPGTDGPSNYDNAYLVFDRRGTAANGLPLFELTVTDLDEVRRRKRQASNWIDLQLAGGRPYGLLF